MNSMLSYLSFTTEIEEEHDEGYMPTLDMGLKMEENYQITYRYYEKPMGNKFCVGRGSAMADSAKEAILSQEVLRRMLNTSEEESQTTRDNILKKFEERMKISGYDTPQRGKIMKRGLIGYEKMKEDCRRKIRPLHRPGSTTTAVRYKKKLLGKCNWYKEKTRKTDRRLEKEDVWHSPAKQWNREESYIKNKTTKKKDEPAKTILFTERTKEGGLITKLRKKEGELKNTMGEGVKLVEKCGNPIKGMLWKADPWGLECEDICCPVCKEEKERKICDLRNIVYASTCLICKDEGRQTLYIGETSRTLKERAEEHIRAARPERKEKKRQDFTNQRKKIEEVSHIKLHQEEEHNGQEIRFKFEVKAQCRSALERQVKETIILKLTEKAGGRKILNSKAEYNRCLMPEVTVTTANKSQKDKKKEERGKDEGHSAGESGQSPGTEDTEEKEGKGEEIKEEDHRLQTLERGKTRTAEERMKEMLEDARKILREENEEVGRGVTNWKRKQEKESMQRRGDEKRRRKEEEMKQNEEEMQKRDDMEGERQRTPPTSQL